MVISQCVRQVACKLCFSRDLHVRVQDSDKVEAV